MRTNRHASIVLLLTMCFATTGYPVEAQQPVSHPVSAGNTAAAAGLIDLSTLLAQAGKTKRRGFSLMADSRDADPNATAFIAPMATGPSLPVTGSGTLGRLTKWAGFTSSNSVIGDTTIYEDKLGKVGIGTDSPTSKLTVAGVIEATGGFKFPDGTVKTSAGVIHDATLKGDGTAVSPLAVAAPAGEPFQREVSVDTVAGFVGTATILVPANKRLLIEFASIRANGFSPVTQPEHMEITTSVGGESATYQLGPVRTVLSGGINTHIASQQVVIWADPGTTVSLKIQFPIVSPSGGFNFTTKFAISGRLFDVLN